MKHRQIAYFLLAFIVVLTAINYDSVIFTGWIVFAVSCSLLVIYLVRTRPEKPYLRNDCPLAECDFPDKCKARDKCRHNVGGGC